MSDELLSEIVGTSYKEVTSTAGAVYGFTTTNQMLKQSDYYTPYAAGIKTGTASETNQCLMTAGKKDGRTIVTVVLGSEDYWTRYAVTKIFYDRYLR